MNVLRAALRNEDVYEPSGKKNQGSQSSPSFNYSDTSPYYSSDAESDTRRKKAKKYRMRLLNRKKKKKNKNKAPAEDPSVSSGKSGGRTNSRPSRIPRNNSNRALPRNNSHRANRLPTEITSDTGSTADSSRRSLSTSNAKGKTRVKPNHAFSTPTFMTEAELYNCMMKPSEEFEFLTSYLNPSTKITRKVRVSDIVRQHFGSPREDGRVGSIRVEVLGCVGLDRHRPDVAVYLVAGDCAFTTDTINGNRSPMWPNSCKRACVFPLHHAYAKLFVGVFDVKQRKSRSRTTEADFYCGRVCIDIPQLRPDTEYDITFPLRQSAFIYDRKPRGVVRLRFSLHWFSERAVLLSYMKRPRNPLAFSKQAKKFPTIPCGDPKTFRNVAVTVHGTDFPGKYTRGSFRATMREFNLYQQNIRFLFKVTILDSVLYENPMMSLYLFITSMYSIWMNSVRWVPAFFTGWIVLNMMENYRSHCESTPGNLGFKPVTIKEIFLGLVKSDKGNKHFFQPIQVKKRPRGGIVLDDGKRGDIELTNHREFPFSERFEYHKFSAAEAIAPSPAEKKKQKKDGGKLPATDLQTARRLSIFMAPIDDESDASSSIESEPDSENENENENGDRDEEGVMEQDDDYEEEELDSDGENSFETEKHRRKRKETKNFMGNGEATLTRPIRVGPNQDSDKRGQKKPPQVQLARVEHMFHKLTKNISVEHVHFPPPHVQVQLNQFSAKGPASDVITQKEKQNFDEFDKLLGFRTKNANPIVRITSSFLGPLMRIIRIVIYMTRIAFNVTTWRDPYLTFWFFAFFVVLTIILIIFPWRTFFFLVDGGISGPTESSGSLLSRKEGKREGGGRDPSSRERKGFRRSREA